jgi:hypothetical protein
LTKIYNTFNYGLFSPHTNIANRQSAFPSYRHLRRQPASWEKLLPPSFGFFVDQQKRFIAISRVQPRKKGKNNNHLHKPMLSWKFLENGMMSNDKLYNS